MKLIYLASIYSVDKEDGTAPTLAEMKARTRKVTEKAAEIMQQGYNVFSPLTHSCPIADFISEENRVSHDFWLRLDFDIIKRCDELWVYMLPGWDRSYGIAKEIEFAEENGIPVKFIKQDTSKYEDGCGCHLEYDEADGPHLDCCIDSGLFCTMHLDEGIANKEDCEYWMEVK